MNRLFLATMISGAALAGGCKDDKTTTGAPAAPATPAATTSPEKKTGHTAGDTHANAVPLGEQTVAGLNLKAKQDEPLKPGGEGAFDLTVTGYPQGQKPKAVRFWVGTEDGKGSAKAKADEESPDTWHTHVEVPNPMPTGAKFWAEIEPATGDKVKASFDLKK